MVVARIPVAVDDPLVASQYGFRPETVETQDEAFFLDGPVASRVAVVDRDPATGQLTIPVPWRSKQRRFVTSKDSLSPAAIALSVFGLVLKTISLFERPDVLGHPISWAFSRPQLLVVPQAGTWANAFYDRYSSSLQFFTFSAPDGSLVRTALSRDIVTHESGHAILDSLAPALYDAVSPETLALHEAIGDLTAVCMALESHAIREWLVQHRQGRIYGSTPASQLANQFGDALNKHHPLRDTSNDLRLSDVDSQEPHSLSQVLTGAAWAAMTQLHDHSMQDAIADQSTSTESVEAKALGVSARRITRILFRALDYVAPAEATFADYVRAVLVADTRAYPEDESGYRRTFNDEFKKRGIPGDLQANLPDEHLRVDVDDLLESDWTAYEFTDKHKSLLGVPAKGPFRVFPRRESQRQYYVGEGKRETRREVILQVTWEGSEPNGDVLSLPSSRAVFKGTTIVIDGRADRRGRYPVLSCLSTDSGEHQVAARTEAVRRLADAGQLLFASRWQANDIRPLAPVVFARTAQNVLRLRGTARLLHLAGVN